MVGAMPESMVVREGSGFSAVDVNGNGYGAANKLMLVLPPPPPPTTTTKQLDQDESEWYEEAIDDNLKLCYSLNSVLYRGTSKYQDIALIDTKHFGKALIIDGKMQSTEADEFIYHESLIHPPLLCHANPNTVFIMGVVRGLQKARC